MLKKYLVTILIVLVSACSASSAREASSVAIDPNHRYEVERLSVLPPQGVGWSGTADTELNRISFGFGSWLDKNATKLSSILISPFPAAFNANDFTAILSDEKEQAEKYNKKFEHLGNSSERPYKRVQIVHKRGMRCVTRETFAPATKSGGKTLSVVYFCEQPNQPEYLPPITISFDESVLPNVDLSNPDTVLAPIWDSIQFKPIDPATSAAYQTWKVKNAEVQRVLREKRERKARKLQEQTLKLTH